MSNDSDKIFSWIPSTGEIIPLRYSGWWIQYPKPSCSKPSAEPPESRHPVFLIGDLVWLKGKPDRVRQILAIEWHCHRHEFVYIVETSARYNCPYWFAPQLALEGHRQVEVEVISRVYQRAKV